MEKQMKRMRLINVSALIAAAVIAGFTAPARADGAAPNASFWQITSDPGSISLTVSGQSAPVVTKVTDATVFAGVCQDCMLPMEFKSGQTGKSCAVCGCSVNNATCLAGKPVKDGTWQSMFKLLPQGAGLSIVYVDPSKPELGLAKVTVNLKAVILSVSGLDALTPDQLLALAKPIGATKVELLDSGKVLLVTLKVDYSAEKAAKLEKAILAASGKINVPAAV
jgi:hypothetical protein